MGYFVVIVFVLFSLYFKYKDFRRKNEIFDELEALHGEEKRKRENYYLLKGIINLLIIILIIYLLKLL